MGDAKSRESVACADSQTLTAAASGDAEAFFTSVAADSDRRRICGLAPIYATLVTLAGRRQGKILGYDQCDADEAGASFVSIAALAY
jgi:MEMO1 family protein